MLVAGREFSEEIIERIRVRVGGDCTVTRTGLSREVCAWPDWRDAHGRLKAMNCRVALLKLARRGTLELPPARSLSFARPARADALDESWPLVEMTLAKLGPVREAIHLQLRDFLRTAGQAKTNEATSL